MRMTSLAAAIAAVAIAAAAGTTSLSGQSKADDVLAATRKAIGSGKLESLKTLSLEARITRNAGNVQVNTDVEMQLEMPDKYWRSDSMSSPMSFQATTGFNGNQSLSSSLGGGTTTMNGATVIRVGPGGAGPGGAPEKLTPEQQAERNRLAVRNSRTEISRLMLGWFGMPHPSVKATYTYAGEAQAPEGRADVIDVKDGDGFSARLFIDQQTHLPLVVTYQGTAPRLMTTGGPGGSGGGNVQTFTRQVGGDGRAMSDEERKKLSAEAESRMKELQTQPPPTVEIKLYFSEWSAVDGIQFPHKIQRATGDTPSEEWVISKVKVNQKIDAKKFQVKSTN